MTTLTLKPQWLLRSFPDGVVALTTENYHQEMLPEYAAILTSLATGVDPDTLDDADFTRIEYLNERGFLNVVNHPDAPAWELSGANFQSVQEQFNHVTISVRDLTANGVGRSLAESLTQAGVKIVELETEARLVIVVTDSYLKIPVIDQQNVLPIVCNRMRVTIGPMQFPWTNSVAKSVENSRHYMPQVNYVLPPAFDALQRAWINTAVQQFLGTNQLKFVRNFVEYDMGQQRTKLWPFDGSAPDADE